MLFANPRLTEFRLQRPKVFLIFNIGAHLQTAIFLSEWENSDDVTALTSQKLVLVYSLHTNNSNFHAGSVVVVVVVATTLKQGVFYLEGSALKLAGEMIAVFVSGHRLSMTDRGIV